jgi:hypothetical protein
MHSETASLRAAFERLAHREPLGKPVSDYTLLEAFGRSFVALSKSGAPALLFPLAAVPTAIARSSAGCTLRPSAEVEFEFAGKSWRQPGAALECDDAMLVETFTVLAGDIATRVSSLPTKTTWSHLVAAFDDWQRLLASRERLSPEGELGLWGELWFIGQAREPDRLIDAWRGPDGAPIDFLLNGIGAEVKASRRRLVHFISQAQVERPVGDYDAYFVSLWVGTDPERGESLGVIAQRLLTHSKDPSVFLRALLKAGYSEGDRSLYSTRFALLEGPAWFRDDSVPRVRQADDGVSNLRYLASFDDGVRLGPEDERLLSAKVLQGIDPVRESK